MRVHKMQKKKKWFQDLKIVGISFYLEYFCCAHVTYKFYFMLVNSYCKIT